VKSSKSLILASASLRRLDLLAQVGVVPNQVIPADIDETPGKGELPRALVERLSRGKAGAVLNSLSPRGEGRGEGDKNAHTDVISPSPKPSPRGERAFILAADTVVACGRRILGKPENEAEERKFLELLSGRRHRVIGGIALACPDGRMLCRTVETTVQFKKLTDAEIDAYIASGEWRGKAGGYAIQGRAEGFVKFIRGAYSNVVGLSLYDTIQMLKGSGYITG